MKLKYFKLRFISPLHIGANRPGLEASDEIIHSDTLFSALINCWKLLYPEDLSRFFPDDHRETFDFPWFRLSSAFPYHGSALYFPRPFIQLNKPNESDNQDPQADRKIKKLKYIDKELFEKILHNDEIGLADCYFSEDGRFLNTAAGHEEPPFIIYDTPRTIKDRRSNETVPFTFTRIGFAESAGLWFAVEFDSQEIEKRFLAALRLLGDTGVGGDRSSGNGQFETDENGSGILELKTPVPAAGFLTLSLYHPKSGELPGILTDSAYQLLERKGWVFSGVGRPLRRQSVRMFREGSVFSGTASGDMVKVLDKDSAPGLDHNIYRCGTALTIPFKTGGA